MAKQLPTLVLVHGAWHRKETWTELINHLPDVDIRTIQNPTSAPVPPGDLGGLLDDARVIRETVESINGPVVVCAHSYGGAPTTQALPGLANVRRIVYISAFIPDVGDSLLDLLGGEMPYFWGKDHLDEGYYEMLDAEKIFYSDLEPEAARRATGALGRHGARSTEPLTQAAWHTIPGTYVLNTKDNAVPLEVQEAVAQRCQRVHRMDASHSPFLSRPAELAEILMSELEDAAVS